MSLVQWRKEYDDSILGPHDGGGCFVVATEAPPYPPGTIKHTALKAAEATPVGISHRTRSNNCE
eukprot:5630897-Lingulodinium_polyedra.AAC.1